MIIIAWKQDEEHTLLEILVHQKCLSSRIDRPPHELSQHYNGPSFLSFLFMRHSNLQSPILLRLSSYQFYYPHLGCSRYMFSISSFPSLAGCCSGLLVPIIWVWMMGMLILRHLSTVFFGLSLALPIPAVNVVSQSAPAPVWRNSLQVPIRILFFTSFQTLASAKPLLACTKCRI